MNMAALKHVPAQEEPQVHHPAGKAHLEVAASRPDLALPAGYHVEHMTPADRSRAALVLRVLTGVQKGAQARVRHQRLLVGNLETECDVVLDTGTSQTQACLIRMSKDGWVVLSIAGDLWVDDTWVGPQQTHDIASGHVLTLGCVSFCVANTATIEWDKVTVPAQRQMQPRSGNLAVVQPKPPVVTTARLQKSHLKNILGRLLFGVLLLGGLSLGGLGLYLVTVAAPLDSPPHLPARDAVQEAKAIVADMPWARELTLQGDSNTRRVWLSGYLPQRENAATLEAALRSKDIDAQPQWTVVDEFRTDLAQRLGVPADRLRHAGQGRFVLVDVQSHLAQVDPAIRRTLQDLPAVRALDVQLSDQIHQTPDMAEGIDAGSPVIIHYARSDGAPGGVAVTGLEQLEPVKPVHYELRDLRLGSLPSIVLDDDTRYFEGATLPGGAVLTQIQPSHLLVREGAQTRRIDITVNKTPAIRKGGPRQKSEVSKGTPTS